jgi:cyclase
MLRRSIVVFVCLFTAATVRAQEDKSADTVFKVTQLNDHMFTVEGGIGITANFVVSTGPDGVLLVDAGRPETVDLLRPFLDSLTEGPVRYVITTHPHDDHHGGNQAFGSEVCVVADSAGAAVMSGGYFALPPLPGTRKVDLLIARDTSIFFNGEEIRLIRVPNAHSAGDLMVWFPKSRILCVGDLLFDHQVPFVDLTIGGDPQRYADNMKRLADTLAPDITIIPGHGAPSTVVDLKEMSEMLRYTTDRVRRAIGVGETAEQVLKDERLTQWASWSRTFETTKMTYWIPCLFQAFQAAADHPLPSICQPLTEVIMSAGIDAALAKYRELKSLPTPQYSIDESDLNMLGYNLMWRQMMPAAEAIFALNVAEHPESGNAYDSMGEYYMNDGQTERAIQNYEKSLEKNPANANAVTMLGRLRSGK